ncbi:MAG: desulfoferrodoxin [Clostridiales bacterium]|jgi:superoxide reductase|nr:desulfoferrodoxin [Clostridiales bacterium]
MKGKQRFFVCESCGNLVGMLVNNAPLVCCGNEMTELTPNTTEASKEKHIPDVKLEGDSLTVSVGSAPHPMEENHHISFVYVETENGGQRKALKPGQEPKLMFRFADDSPVAVYAYCNVHGLWGAQL